MVALSLRIGIRVFTGRVTRSAIRGGTAALFLALTSPSAPAQEDGLRLDSDVSVSAMAPFLSILRDPSAGMTMEDARAAFREGRFEKNKNPWPQFGYTPDAIWTRAELHSDLAEAATWYIELRTARMDELDFFMIRDDGTVRHLQGGNLQSHSPEMMDSKYPVFPVHLSPGEEVALYLRVYSAASVHIPLRVWNPRAYAEAQSRTEALFASFFGYIFALIIMSLVFSVFARERGFVIYSLSLVALIANYFITTGYYAWLHLPAVAFAVHQGTVLAAQSTLILLLVYQRVFFDTPVTMPKLDRWISRVIIPGSVVAMLFMVMGPYRVMIQLLLLEALLIGLFSMSVAVISWRRGNQVARFYFLGWIAFWFLFVWTVFQFRGWARMPTVPEYPGMLGIAASMTLFFLAMADRVRDLRRRADQSKIQILDLERQVSRELQNQSRQQEQLIRDLHDGIGGLTANVGILAEIGRRDAADEKSREGFRRVSDLASEGGAEIHGLMSSLESRDLQWPDFIVECRRQGDMRLAAHGIAFEMDIQGDSDVAGPGLFPGMSLLRVFKEALTNVVKHAEATRVDVVMVFEPALFKMTIRDDGKGVRGSFASGRGLANMGARIRELGGRMEAHAGQGTELVFEVPLPIKPPEQGIKENEASA